MEVIALGNMVFSTSFPQSSSVCNEGVDRVNVDGMISGLKKRVAHSVDDALLGLYEHTPLAGANSPSGSNRLVNMVSKCFFIIPSKLFCE